MSDDFKIQLSDKANGTLINVRANTGEELAELFTGEQPEEKGLVKNADTIVSGFNAVKELFIAKGILTQPVSSGSGGSFKGAGSAAGGSESSGGTPTCKHGEMKDLSSKNYKSTHYCTEKDRDKQCKPQNLR